MEQNQIQARRLGGLRRFAISITVFNIIGRLLLGFEQSWAQMFAAAITAYVVELGLEWVSARTTGRAPKFRGGFRTLVDYLLPAHIASMAISMLLYSNDRVGPIMFAVIVAIASKSILRLRINGSSRHFFNPSNLGIATTLVVFPWVGIAPPYHFTENLSGIGDWILPVAIALAGTMINSKFTGKMPLILAWLGTFALQAIGRSLVLGTPVVSALGPMTGVAFILFTFYMITDPSTSPLDPRSQVFFGMAVAITYMVLVLSHIVFGLFFALTIVCGLRGIGLYLQAQLARFTQRNVVVSPQPALRTGNKL
ncbi:MAG TPA: enediyne biosynthesis protein UnbU [Herpetosiphonaceae bacterium]